jgi:hypothetical protein
MNSPRESESTVLPDETGLVQVLRQLESAWRRQGAPIADTLMPGLGANEVDERASEEGVIIPAGLKSWWGWHNGTDPGAVQSDSRSTGTAYDFLSIEESLERRRHLLAKFGTSDEPDLPDWYWRPSWLPFAGAGPFALFVDTSERLTYTPVRALDPMWDEIHDVRAMTLTEVAEAWLHILDRGWAEWDRILQGWSWKPSMPLYMRLSGLI